MGWHVLSSTYFDFDRFERESRADTLPEHLLPKIADRLGATIHQPDPGGRVRLTDRLGAKLYGTPSHWALARRVYPELADGDAVYAAGCDAGLPLAVRCAVRRRNVSFAIAFADTARTRTKLLVWLVGLLRLRLTAVVTTDFQAELAEEAFGRFVASIHVVEGQTDCRFFRPPVQRPDNEPPLIASSGVERRDYLTMAAGLDGMDLEGVICFASPNRTSKTKYTMPDPVPANLDFTWMEFVDLRDLYQQTDLLVLPLIENRYSAGLTTLFEAIACGAPVVVTESPGIIQRLIDEDLVIGVPPGDAGAIARAVKGILADPATARARAERARAVVAERYSADTFLDLLERLLTDFVPPLPVT